MGVQLRVSVVGFPQEPLLQVKEIVPSLDVNSKEQEE